MKKQLATMLAGVLAVSSLAACGGDSAPAATNTTEDGSWAPAKSLQIVVPFGAGGDTDVNARLFAKYLSKELGVNVGVTNTSGAAGMTGTQQVLDAQPDGYTMLWSHTEILIPYIAGTSAIQISDLDVAGIGMLTDTTVLAVRSDAAFQSVDELVTAAQAAPGDIEFGMSTGGYPHLIGIALEDELDVDFNLVNIGGNADKITALLGGHTDVINVEYALAKDYFDSGAFTCIGLLSAERNDLFPEIPTLVEMGYDLEFNKFFFFGFPQGTPDVILDTVSSAMEAVVASPDFQSECAGFYITPTYMDMSAANSYITGVNSQLNSYGDLFRAAVAG